MTKIVTDQLQRRDGVEFTLPLKDGTAGQSLLTDGKGNLTFTPATVGEAVVAPGQAFYGFGAGTYAWTCPPGVTSVCVVCIGGGAGNPGQTYSSGQGGGGLGWKNDIPVSPGKTYTVQVGNGGESLGGRPFFGQTDSTGGTSFFIDTNTVCGRGGAAPGGGTWVGDGGGNGGYNGGNGGGGAGGYTGNGGGSSTADGSGGGGAAGGAYSSTYGYASGGGTGPFGQGASGSGGSYMGGGGGSGGEQGRGAENPYFSRGSPMLDGGLYGGGSGAGGNSTERYGTHRGGRGCVRIIWGTGRKFPSTGTGDM